MKRWNEQVEKRLYNSEPLSYWHKFVKTFPGNGATAIVILMRLSFGSDYPSNIADYLKNSDLINIRGLGILGSSNNVAAIMKDMQKAKFLILDGTVKSIPERSYYRLNPEILSTFRRSSPTKSPGKKGIKYSIIPEEIVQNFLEELSGGNAKTFNIINFEEIEDEFRSPYGIEIEMGADADRERGNSQEIYIRSRD